jgi:hypothetical protein
MVVDLDGADTPTWIRAIFSKTLLLFHGIVVTAVAFAAWLLAQFGG